MLIMGFDPGGTTGWAAYETDGDIWWRDQLDEPEHHEALWNEMLARMPDVIVCERFSLRNNIAANLAAIEYIGVLKCFAALSNIEFYAQTPSQAKGFWNNYKLQKVDLYIPSAPHAMDATRHVLYFMMLQKVLPSRYLEAQRPAEEP